MGRRVSGKMSPHRPPVEKNGAVRLLGGGLRIQPVMAADEKLFPASSVIRSTFSPEKAVLP